MRHPDTAAEPHPLDESMGLAASLLPMRTFKPLLDHLFDATFSRLALGEPPEANLRAACTRPLKLPARVPWPVHHSGGCVVRVLHLGCRRTCARAAGPTGSAGSAPSGARRSKRTRTASGCTRRRSATCRAAPPRSRTPASTTPTGRTSSGARGRSRRARRTTWASEPPLTRDARVAPRAVVLFSALLKPLHLCVCALHLGCTSAASRLHLGGAAGGIRVRGRHRVGTRRGVRRAARHGRGDARRLGPRAARH